ncbi:hypothetical protein NC652_018245 [Populus alba x Populus x berolinensis]|nr:hypothetical protein NC652_018245 [Populus alba x Populus x berolinensis]
MISFLPLISVGLSDKFDHRLFPSTKGMKWITWLITSEIIAGNFMADSESEDDDDDDEYDHLYRQTRLEQYKNYEKRTSIRRNCETWFGPTSKHDVYLMSTLLQRYKGHHYVAEKNEVLNFSANMWHLVRNTRKPLRRIHTNSSLVHCTVKDMLLTAGGFQGAHNLQVFGSTRCYLLLQNATKDDNAITNAQLRFMNVPVHFKASNNDSGVRNFDSEIFQQTKHFFFDWPILEDPLLLWEYVVDERKVFLSSIGAGGRLCVAVGELYSFIGSSEPRQNAKAHYVFMWARGFSHLHLLGILTSSIISHGEPRQNLS